MVNRKMPFAKHFIYGTVTISKQKVLYILYVPKYIYYIILYINIYK